MVGAADGVGSTPYWLSASTAGLWDGVYGAPDCPSVPPNSPGGVVVAHAAGTLALGGVSDATVSADDGNNSGSQLAALDAQGVALESNSPAPGVALQGNADDPVIPPEIVTAVDALLAPRTPEQVAASQAAVAAKAVADAENDALEIVPDDDGRMSLPQIRVAARRQKVRTMLARRMTTREIAQTVSVSLRTVEHDIQAIKAEWTTEHGSATAMAVAGDVHRRSMERDRELWVMYMRLGAEKTVTGEKLDILRELRANQASELKALQSLGVVYRAPERLAVDMRMMAKLDQLPPGDLAALADITDPIAFRRALAAHVGIEEADAMLGAVGVVDGAGPPRKRLSRGL